MHFNSILALAAAMFAAVSIAAPAPAANPNPEADDVVHLEARDYGCNVWPLSDDVGKCNFHVS